MARRHVPIAFTIPEDTRPSGTVQFADPTRAEQCGDVHTFNEPYSPRSQGHQDGIKPTFERRNPWVQQQSGRNAWAEMNRKRGFSTEDED